MGPILCLYDEGICAENVASSLSKKGDRTSRELIIDETGTVTLPPDLLVRLGGAGRYTVGNINSGYISLQGESVESMGKMVLASTCPACKHDYKDSDEQLCPSCGSSRPMVEA